MQRFKENVNLEKKKKKKSNTEKGLTETGTIINKGIFISFCGLQVYSELATNTTDSFLQKDWGGRLYSTYKVMMKSKETHEFDNQNPHV